MFGLTYYYSKYLHFSGGFENMFDTILHFLSIIFVWAVALIGMAGLVMGLAVIVLMALGR
jgi:hypothetical protein